jgi:hypothetical protein
LFRTPTPWNAFAVSWIIWPTQPRGETMRSLLLWLIGVPIPVIIIIWLFTGHA